MKKIYLGGGGGGISIHVLNFLNIALEELRQILSRSLFGLDQVRRIARFLLESEWLIMILPFVTHGVFRTPLGYEQCKTGKNVR